MTKILATPTWSKLIMATLIEIIQESHKYLNLAKLVYLKDIVEIYYIMKMGTVVLTLNQWLAKLINLTQSTGIYVNVIWIFVQLMLTYFIGVRCNGFSYL